MDVTRALALHNKQQKVQRKLTSQEHLTSDCVRDAIDNAINNDIRRKQKKTQINVTRALA
jgi:hypothetical protein